MSKSAPLFYKIFGNANNPCVILIPGIGGQSSGWPTEFTEGLVHENFFVVTFDHRDSGLSPYYDHLGTPDFNEAIAAKQQGKIFTPPYTLKDMASDIIKLMDHLKIKKAHIVGGSMGGVIAQIFALNYASRTLSLTCISSTSGDPQLSPPKPEVQTYFASALSPQKTPETVESWIEKKLALYKIYYHPDHVDETKIRAYLKESYQRGHNPSGFKRQLFALMCAEPRVEKLKKLEIKTLIIHGDYDPVFSIEHGQQLADIIPQAQLAIIEKMGHGLPEVLCQKLVNICSHFYKKIADNS